MFQHNFMAGIAGVLRMKKQISIAIGIVGLIFASLSNAHTYSKKSQMGSSNGFYQYAYEWGQHNSNFGHSTVQNATLNLGPWSTFASKTGGSGSVGPVILHMWYRARICTDGFLQGSCIALGSVWIPAQQCGGGAPK